MQLITVKLSYELSNSYSNVSLIVSTADIDIANIKVNIYHCIYLS